MKHKIMTGLAVFALVILIAYFPFGCGKNAPPNPTTNYSIGGKVGAVTASGLHSFDVLTVTHIVAISATNDKTLATLGSDGTFSLAVDKGMPYVLGFFNKNSGHITLLGYLTQNDVNWNSLPLMNPTSEATDLGTVNIDQTNQEAIPSINLTSLIAQMNMDLSTAQFYGTIDKPLTSLTNLDVDGNGEFDFQENKAYLINTFINMGTGSSGGTGEVAKMYSGYNDTYKPKPSGYDIVISAQGDTKTAGSAIVITPPVSVINASGVTYKSVTSSIEAGTAGFWCVFTKPGNCPIISPEVAPNGTYTAVTGSST